VECPFGRSGGFPGPCVGLSDVRAHGICAASRLNCLSPSVGPIHEFTNPNLLNSCEDASGVPCACMVLDTQAFPPDPEREFEVGHVVTADGCRAYQALFPDVRCVDAEWRPI